MSNSQRPGKEGLCKIRPPACSPPPNPTPTGIRLRLTCAISSYFCKCNFGTVRIQWSYFWTDSKSCYEFPCIYITVSVLLQQPSCSYSVRLQQLLCDVEESLANLYRYQVRSAEAGCWYIQVLRSTTDLLTLVQDPAMVRALTETKGRTNFSVGAKRWCL